MLTFLLFSGLLILPCCLSLHYYFVNELQTWAAAQQYCRLYYTDLVTIENENEQMNVMSLVSYFYSDSFWIGLYEDVQNSWRWYLDDDAFYGFGERNYRNWTSTAPDNYGGKEMCTQMITDGSWNDVNCNLLAPFICYNGANNSYIMVSVSMNVSDARQYCRQYYTDLISIRNAPENEEILNLAAGQAVWIGLYRTRLWSDHSNSTYENWYPGEPNNFAGDEHCTMVYPNGKWNDIFCYYIYPFVCYSDTITTSTPGPSTTILATEVTSPTTATTDTPTTTATTGPSTFGIEVTPTTKASTVTPTTTATTGLPTLPSWLSRHYYYVSDWQTWTAAQQYCRQYYTDLVTTRNENELMQVISLVDHVFPYSIWIGLYEDMQNSWRWYLDDDAFYGFGERNYRNWTSTAPDNNGGKETCTQMMTDGSWNDVNCNLLAQFICYNGANNSYIMVSVSMNVFDARQYCRQYYTDLISIRNATENEEILNLAAGQAVWIGLYRTRLWSDHSNSTYENWSPREPNNAGGNEHCTVAYLNGKWNDIPCDFTYPFVCYWDTPTTTATPGPSTFGTEVTPTTNATTEMAYTSPTSARTNATFGPVTPTTFPTTAMTNTTFVPVFVIGGRVKITTARNLTMSQIENLILKEIPQVLINGSLPSTVRIRVNHVKKNP